MAEGGHHDVAALIAEALRANRGDEGHEGHPRVALPQPAVNRDHRIDKLITSIKNHKVEPIDAVLARGKSCPVAAVFVAGTEVTMGEGSVANIGDPQRCCGVSG